VTIDIGHWFTELGQISGNQAVLMAVCLRGVGSCTLMQLSQFSTEKEELPIVTMLSARHSGQLSLPIPLSMGAMTAGDR